MSEFIYDEHDTPAARVRRHYDEFKETFAEQGRQPSRTQRSEYMLIYAAVVAESDEEIAAALTLLAEDLAAETRASEAVDRLRRRVA